MKRSLSEAQPQGTSGNPCNIRLESVRPVWLHVSDGDNFLLLEDLDTGDVLLPLIYMKEILEANYSRKLASFKYRQVVVPNSGPLSQQNGLVFWQWAFESPHNVKLIVRKELGEDKTPQGHLRLVLLPIVYNALVDRHRDVPPRGKALFHALHHTIKNSTYWPLLVSPSNDLIARLNSQPPLLENGGSDVNASPLFNGPRNIEQTALKYMFMFRDQEELEASKRARTTGAQGADATLLATTVGQQSLHALLLGAAGGGGGVPHLHQMQLPNHSHAHSSFMMNNMHNQHAGGLPPGMGGQGLLGPGPGPLGAGHDGSGLDPGMNGMNMSGPGGPGGYPPVPMTVSIPGGLSEPGQLGGNMIMQPHLNQHPQMSLNQHQNQHQHAQHLSQMALNHHMPPQQQQQQQQQQGSFNDLQQLQQQQQQQGSQGLGGGPSANKSIMHPDLMTILNNQIQNQSAGLGQGPAQQPQDQQQQNGVVGFPNGNGNGASVGGPGDEGQLQQWPPSAVPMPTMENGTASLVRQVVELRFKDVLKEISLLKSSIVQMYSAAHRFALFAGIPGNAGPGTSGPLSSFNTPLAATFNRNGSSGRHNSGLMSVQEQPEEAALAVAAAAAADIAAGRLIAHQPSGIGNGNGTQVPGGGGAVSLPGQLATSQGLPELGTEGTLHLDAEEIERAQVATAAAMEFDAAQLLQQSNVPGAGGGLGEVEKEKGAIGEEKGLGIPMLSSEVLIHKPLTTKGSAYSQSPIDG